MARGVNKVILLGNVGQDPEVRFTPAGVAVANLSLATSDNWTDKQSGQKQERTEWHRLVMFSKLAEIAQQYVKKGSKLYIEGKIQTRKWQDQQGQDRYSTEVLVNDMQMLDSPGQGQQGGQQRQPGQSNSQGFASNGQQDPRQQPQQQTYQHAQAQYAQQQAQGPQPGAHQDFDDSIPFARLHNAYGG